MGFFAGLMLELTFWPALLAGAVFMVSDTERDVLEVHEG